MVNIPPLKIDQVIEKQKLEERSKKHGQALFDLPDYEVENDNT